MLGHRLIDVENARLVRAADLELAKDGDEWVLAGVDTRRRPRRLFGLLGPDNPQDAGGFRDWHDFEWLIGHQSSALLRGPFARIRRLKPAQIADLLEDASKEEETEILGQVHADPELEADVFEELDEDLATRLLGARTDEEIAAVLARMRADDAADAIAELPQRRRQPVLDLLPPGQRTKVLTLMGFNPTSAGGLMSMDFVAVPRKASVADALARVREAVSLQPEALTSVHAVERQRPPARRGQARHPGPVRSGRHGDRRVRHRSGPGGPGRRYHGRRRADDGLQPHHHPRRRRRAPPARRDHRR